MIIFYADDDADDRDFLVDGFREINPAIRCLTARDGQELLDTLPQLLVLPDYIFLDINMPIMGGKECLIRLKDHSAFRHIPVVIYSTSTDNHEINYLYALGAYKCIRKPDSVHRLMASLKVFVEHVQKEQLHLRN